MTNEPGLVEELSETKDPQITIKRHHFLVHHASFDEDTESANHGERIEDHYELGSELGKGRFAKVLLATHKRTGQKRAIKTLKKTQVKPEAFWKETRILKTLDHPNLLRLYESFEDKNHYYIVTEWATRGNLLQFFASHIDDLSEVDFARLLKQILVCVNHCHAHNIIHCDLKMENILLDDNDNSFHTLTLCDFGYAQFYNDEKLRRGTPEYVAPEVYRGSYGPKCDIWSCGVLAFVLFTGQFPFTGKNTQELYNQMKYRKDHFDLDWWTKASPEGKSFVQALLTVDEAERPTAREALDHPWFDTIVSSQSQQSATSSGDDATSTSPWNQNLMRFSAHQKLKQATYAFLVAQLTFKSRKKVIDDIFRSVDTNSDGKISRQEIEASFRQKGQILSKEELSSIFQNVDIDQNGCINYWEFTAATMNVSTMLCTDNLKTAFEAFDLNKNNAITAEDLKILFNQNGAIGEEGEEVDDTIIEAMIEQCDANGDGEVSLEEFISMMQENILSNKRQRDCLDEEE